MPETLPNSLCPECGAAQFPGQTCPERFHQMLAWESEGPTAAEVHHLLVLCYHLQHPSLYSPEGLAQAQALLAEFVERGTSPAEVRRRHRAQVDSGRRQWKIRGTAAAHGAYVPPMQWTMTAADIVAGGIEPYAENVRAWARSILAALKDRPA